MQEHFALFRTPWTNGVQATADMSVCVTAFRSDFETAAFSSMEHLFPKVKVKLCFFISARPSGEWCRSMDRIHFISVKSSSPLTSENCLCWLSQKRATSDRSSQNSRTHFQRRLRDSSGTSGNIHWWLQKCSLRPWPAVCCMSWVEAIPVPCSHVVHLWKDLQDGLCTTHYWEGWLYFSTL